MRTWIISAADLVARPPDEAVRSLTPFRDSHSLSLWPALRGVLAHRSVDPAVTAEVLAVLERWSNIFPSTLLKGIAAVAKRGPAPVTERAVRLLLAVHEQRGAAASTELLTLLERDVVPPRLVEQITSALARDPTSAIARRLARFATGATADLLERTRPLAPARFGDLLKPSGAVWSRGEQCNAQGALQRLGLNVRSGTLAIVAANVGWLPPSMNLELSASALNFTAVRVSSSSIALRARTTGPGRIVRWLRKERSVRDGMLLMDADDYAALRTPSARSKRVAMELCEFIESANSSGKAPLARLSWKGFPLVVLNALPDSATSVHLGLDAAKRVVEVLIDDCVRW